MPAEPGQIIHVVLINWSEAMSPSALKKARETARGLVGKIPGIADLREGPSVSPEGLEGGFDYAVAITFDDAAARDQYLPHAEHEVLVEQIRSFADRVIVFDLAAS